MANILCRTKGTPNFVMAEEYPAAKASGIDILPAQMEPTDQEALESMEQVYLQSLKVLGETHPDIITALKTWQATQKRLKSPAE